MLAKNSWGKKFKIFARYIYSSASLGRSLPPKYISDALR